MRVSKSLVKKLTLVKSLAPATFRSMSCWRMAGVTVKVCDAPKRLRHVDLVEVKRPTEPGLGAPDEAGGVGQRTLPGSSGSGAEELRHRVERRAGRGEELGA